MCLEANAPTIRLGRCSHGSYHLAVGATTLHLSEDELSSISRAINELAARQPTLLGKMLLDDSLKA